MSRYSSTANELDRIARAKGHCMIVGEVAEPVMAMAELGWHMDQDHTGHRWLWSNARGYIDICPDGASADKDRVMLPCAIWHHDTVRVFTEWPSALHFYTKSPLRARLSAWCDGCDDDEIVRRFASMKDTLNRIGPDPLAVVEALRKENAILASQAGSGDDFSDRKIVMLGGRPHAILSWHGDSRSDDVTMMLRRVHLAPKPWPWEAQPKRDDDSDLIDEDPPAEDDEADRLRTLINTPMTGDWMAAVPLEAAHQIERWGTTHDAGKANADWFWLVGYLAGKALHAASAGDVDKAKHHTVSTGAALLNWHRALTGENTAMRPGIAPPPELGPDAMATIAEQARAVTAIASKEGLRYIVATGDRRARDVARHALLDAGWGSSNGMLATDGRWCGILPIPTVLVAGKHDLVWLVGAMAQSRRAAVQARVGPACRIFPAE